MICKEEDRQSDSSLLHSVTTGDIRKSIAPELNCPIHLATQKYDMAEGRWRLIVPAGKHVLDHSLGLYTHKMFSSLREVGQILFISTI